MKNLRKVVKMMVVMMVVVCLSFGSTFTVWGATAVKYNDGSYSTESVSEDGKNTFKLNVEVKDNQIDQITFDWYSGENKMSSLMMIFVPDEWKELSKASLQETKDYEEQLNATKDASQVVANPQFDGSKIYNMMTNCWQQFVDKAKVAVIEPTLKKTSTTLYLTGAKKKLSSTIELNNADGYTVTYKSKNASVSTVSKKGIVTAKKAGTSVIEVTFNDGSNTFTKTFKVVVKAK